MLFGDSTGHLRGNPAGGTGIIHGESGPPVRTTSAPAPRTAFTGTATHRGSAVKEPGHLSDLHEQCGCESPRGGPTRCGRPRPPVRGPPPVHAGTAVQSALASRPKSTCRRAARNSPAAMRATVGVPGEHWQYPGAFVSASCRNSGRRFPLVNGRAPRPSLGRDHPRGKPEPDLFPNAAHRTGVPPSACAVVEDSAPGVQAARRGHARLRLRRGTHRCRPAGRPGHRGLRRHARTPRPARRARGRPPNHAHHVTPS
ncbi:HAD family hydrolase [Kitasatospora sp. NPDC057500]|uniref:HAD family hydrolase n=1 Tax=Kitasatospora sp. NPDC057500 TaxID=3346151 RepID=UPI0036C82D42